MAKLTRRTFITRTTVGVATIGVVAGAFGAEAVNNLTVEAPSALSNPLMVYVTDAASGEMTFLMGTRQVTRHDRALVARLVKVMA